MPNRFCAICGKGIDENDPHFGLCYSCYLKENPLFELPEEFSFNICLDCGNYSKKENWIKPENNDLLATINEALNKYMLQSYIKKERIEFSTVFKSFTNTSPEVGGINPVMIFIMVDFPAPLGPIKPATSPL